MSYKKVVSNGFLCLRSVLLVFHCLWERTVVNEIDAHTSSRSSRTCRQDEHSGKPGLDISYSPGQRFWLFSLSFSSITKLREATCWRDVSGLRLNATGMV